MKFFFSFALLFLACSISLSQIDESKRYDETEVEMETKFVEASQLQLLGRYEDAVKKFEALAKIDAENSVVFFQLSRCYKSLEQLDKAVKSAEQSFKLDPKNEFIVRQLAECYEANQLPEKAAETYVSYTKVNPKDNFFYEKSVFLYLQLRDYSKAIALLDKLEKVNGIDESVSRQKFEIYSKQDQSKKAIKELVKLSKAFPSNERYSLNLANYYVQLGQMDKAQDVFEKLLKKDPDNETAARFMKKSQSKGGSSSKMKFLAAISADIPNKSISIDDKIAKLVPVLQQLVNKPDPVLSNELIEISTQLVQTYPTDAKAFALYGDVLYNSGNYSEAIDAYNATIALNGAIFDVWYQLMSAERKLARFDDLLLTSDKALLRFPNQGIAYLFHGFALNKKEKATSAQEILKEASLYASGDANLRRGINTELARSLYLLKKYDQALETLTKEEINTADAYELRGDLLFSKSDSSSAVSFWRKALELDPTNKKLSEKISQKQL